MKPYHVTAIIPTAALAVLIAYDAVSRATTGDPTWVTDDALGSDVSAVALSIVLGAAFGAGALVLLAEKALFTGAGPFLRGVRMFSIVALTVTAVGQAVLHPIEKAAGADPESTYAAVSALVGMLCLGVAFVCAFILGLASLRGNRLGLGGRVLAAIGPVLLGTVALAFIAPTLASPVFCTLTVLLGFATVGVGAPRRARIPAAVRG